MPRITPSYKGSSTISTGVVYAPYIPLYTKSSISVEDFNMQISPFWYNQVVNGLLPSISEISIFHYEPFLSWLGSLEYVQQECKKEYTTVIANSPWRSVTIEGRKFVGAYYIYVYGMACGHITESSDLYGPDKKMAWRWTIIPLWREYQKHLETLNAGNAGVPADF